MFTVRRAAIRHYIANLLISGAYAVDVGGRVFANRQSTLFLEELPAVFVTYGDESAEIIAGSAFVPKEYQKNLNVTITVVVEAIQSSGDDIVQNSKAEDLLDYLSYQVERAVAWDWMLGRNLTGFDPNTNIIGLTHGHRLTGTRTYEVETENERRMIAQDLRFEFPYDSPATLDHKLPDFETFYAGIIRVGADGSTVDPVLMEMQTNFESYDPTDGPSFCVTTNRNGLYTLSLRGGSGVVYFDWGEGDELEEFTLTPLGVDATHTYPDGSSKLVRVYGVLSNITYIYGINQGHVEIEIDDVVNIEDFYNGNNSGCAIDLATVTDKAAMVNLNLRGNTLTGNLSDLILLVDLATLNFENTAIGCTSDPLPAWVNANLQCQNCNWASTEVDDCLIQMSAAGVANCVINIAGSNAARTAASDVALAALIADGCTVTVN